MALRIAHEKNYEVDNVTTTTTSTVVDVQRLDSFSIQAVVDVNTPAAVTFDSDTNEVQTLTFDTKANTTHQDLVIVEDAAGVSYAIALTKPVVEVQTLTFDTKANTTHQDFIIVQDAAALTYAIALTKPVAEVQTLTFPSVAASTGGDYVVITDGAGLTWAISLDKSGSDPEPTGAAWVAVDAARKVHVNISGGTDAASVAALVETDFDGLTGATTAVVTDDSAANGTMTLTMGTKAPCTNPDPHNADDSGVGSILGVETTAGVASVAPSGPLWTAVNAARKGLADISADTTAAEVAARAETALNALTGFTAAITTDDSAANGTMTLTQVAVGPVVNPVPKNASEAGAGSIAGVETTAGVASVAPAGALWTAADHKGLADISGDTTAAQVAARAETAFNALTGFTAAITTDDSAANGTMTLTQVEFGATVNPVPKNAAESGAGSIAGVETTPGYSSELELTDDEATIPSHGLTTGLKGQLTTTGTLPTGLSGGTDYYIIVVDANTVKFASSLANALAGTDIDITGEGDGRHTFTPTSLAGATVTLQKSNDYDPITGGGNFDAVASATSITADGNVWFEIDKPKYKYARLSYTLTAGRLSTDNYFVGKENL